MVELLVRPWVADSFRSSYGSGSHVIGLHACFKITVCYDAQTRDPKVVARYHGDL